MLASGMAAVYLLGLDDKDIFYFKMPFIRHTITSNWNETDTKISAQIMYGVIVYLVSYHTHCVIPNVHDIQIRIRA